MATMLTSSVSSAPRSALAPGSLQTCRPRLAHRKLSQVSIRGLLPLSHVIATRRTCATVRGSAEPAVKETKKAQDDLESPIVEVLEPLANRSSNQETSKDQFKSLQSLLGLPGLVAMSAMFSLISGVDLEGPGSVIGAMSVLAIIVTVHELGHFTAARSLGIHVTKFAVGFGPLIFKYQDPPEQLEPETPALPPPQKQGFSLANFFKKKEEVVEELPKTRPGVEYSLRLIPLGGYVAFPDDEEENSTYPSDDPDLLKNRPLLDRIIVVSAGVIANFIFAYSLLFTEVNTVGLTIQQFQPGVAVPRVVAGGAGEKGGLRDGDIIVEVQGQTLPASEFSVSELVSVIKERPNEKVQLLVRRQEALETITLQPTAANDGTGRINVQLAPNLRTRPLYAENFLDGASLAWQETVRLTTLVTDGLKQLASNFGEAAERLSGPVAIVAVGAEVARTSTPGLFQFAAIVNLNLAVVNLLPLPALDGGFLLLLLVEGARGGRKLPQEVERAIMSSGLLLLLTMGVFLIVRDTVNLGVFAFL